MECSIGYSFGSTEIFVELVVIEDVDMVGVIEYIENLIVENHKGKSLSDLKGLSILIKE